MNIKQIPGMIANPFGTVAGMTTGNVHELAGFLERAQSRDGSASLTQYAKNTVITGRTYIEDTLASEDVMLPLMGTLNQIYCGYVITALGINQYVADGRTVREMLSVVSTEAYVDVLDVVASDFGKVDMNAKVEGMEATVLNIDSDAQRLVSARIIELKLSIRGVSASIVKDKTETQNFTGSQTLATTKGSGDSITDTGFIPGSFDQTKKTTEKLIPATYKQIPDPSNPSKTIDSTEIDEPAHWEKVSIDHGLSGATHGSTTNSNATNTTQNAHAAGGSASEKNQTNYQASEVTIYLMVQLIPTLITKQTVAGFLTLNFDPSIWQRLSQVKAGEIKFWKDFVFAHDLIKKHSAALKQDRSQVLAHMLSIQQNKLFQRMGSVSGYAPERHNLASSILIVDKRTIDRSCNEVGIKFDAPANQPLLSPENSARQRFFEKSYMMIIVVVDTLYNSIKMYFNGIDVTADYSFSMIQRNAKGKDSFDLKEVMSAFGQGAVPKF